MLDNTSNQRTKFRAKNLFEINDDLRRTCSTGNQIKFKTSMLKSVLCGYSDTCILASGTLSLENTTAQDADASNRNKNVFLKIVLHMLIA